MKSIFENTLILFWLSALALLSCGGEQAVEKQPQPGGTSSEMKVAFADITASAGLGDFSHNTGEIGDKWFPEAMGSGCGFIDYNGDGWQDVLLVGGGKWPKDQSEPVPALWLYRNNGDETFTLVNEEAGLSGITAYGYGITVGDIDNDGDDDFYFTTLWENMLFRNDGGTFTEIGKSAGVAGEAVWSTSTIFFDADKDGWLDLYVGSYVAWSPETDLFCTLDGETKSYCTPELYKGIPSRYYRNNGDGTFSDHTEKAGFLPAPGKTLGVVEFDYNRDGWPDLAVANDTQRDLLYQNNGDGTFSEIGTISGIAYDENGRARAGMGIDAGVVDATGNESIFIGNFSKEMISVFRYIGNNLFNDRAASSKIGRPSLLTLTFGLFLFDVDLDGDLDLFTANGHVQREIETTQDGITYAEPPHLFLNKGKGKFEDVGPAIGGVFTQPIVGRGAAFADIDNDGDLDILVTENGRKAHLWRNDLTDGGNYLRLQVEGRESNRNGCGTQVSALVNGVWMERRVRTGASFLSNSEKTATFGLGAAAALDSMKVAWPGGTVEIFTNVAANQELWLVEGEGKLKQRGAGGEVSLVESTSNKSSPPY